jgi:hypothetical protein
MSGVIHPAHDALAQEVRSWFTLSYPEIGLQVAHHWFGTLSDLGDTETRLLLAVDEPGLVASALAEARAASGDRTLIMWVDEHARALRLEQALLDSGCRRGEATVHLALVGEYLGQTGPDGLLVERVTEDGLERWARVKLQSFDDAESEPTLERLGAEVAARRSELPLTQCQLGLLGDEAVAVLAHYEGEDQLVFNLGTRLPYRHQGIAQGMLGRWVAAGRAAGCRSLIINAHDGGRPADLYRRLGFVDEVYWYQSFQLGVDPAQ